MAARMHRVVVLLLEPVVGYDASIPPQLFGEARDDAGDPLYEVLTASLDGGPVRTEHGYAILPSHDAGVVATADTVIVPGTRYPPARRDGIVADDVRHALDLLPAHARLVSICTGAFVLAAAGRLSGHRATTHWARAGEFRALFPDVDLDESTLYVDEGDVLTSAGLAAGADLCLHLIRRDHGAAVANAVARHCVVPPWRDGGQAQFIEAHLPDPTGDSTAETRSWARLHLDDPLDVAMLARHAQMSLRTFNRRFRDETGMSPGAWLVDQRVRAARRLLETTDLPIDDVARRAGLGTGAGLRQHLRRSLGTSPMAYRRTFRAG